jgi:predicted GNAT superfamily acetyltransferase
MISVQHAGGLVLGAFEGERLVGFAFGYLGRVRGRWALYSQLAGVDPSVQDRGVGRQLKLAQRAWAREQGLDLVAWSFDPLQAGNANFNLNRLGATSRTYEPNYFGERTDALNAGLDTDRLLVEWPVEDRPRAWRDVTGGPSLVFDPHAPEALTWSEPPGGGAREIWLPAPLNIAAVKRDDPALARRWQAAVRSAFQRMFGFGFVAMSFVRPEGETYGCYVLRLPAEG